MSAELVHVWCIKQSFKDTIVVHRNHRYSDSLRCIFLTTPLGRWVKTYELPGCSRWDVRAALCRSCSSFTCIHVFPNNDVQYAFNLGISYLCPCPNMSYLRMCGSV